MTAGVQHAALSGGRRSSAGEVSHATRFRDARPPPGHAFRRGGAPTIAMVWPAYFAVTSFIRGDRTSGGFRSVALVGFGARVQASSRRRPSSPRLQLRDHAAHLHRRPAAILLARRQHTALLKRQGEAAQARDPLRAQVGNGRSQLLRVLP